MKVKLFNINPFWIMLLTMAAFPVLHKMGVPNEWCAGGFMVLSAIFMLMLLAGMAGMGGKPRSK